MANTATERPRTKTPPVPRQDRAVATKPPSDAVKYVYDKAAVNALPPQIWQLVDRPAWEGQPLAWLASALIYAVASIASGVLWLFAIGVWMVLHLVLWVNAHPLRTAVAAGAGIYAFIRYLG
ncbi:putative membrane protein [Candidatus Protofrankia californiensis]|uniref:Putative membrane protein n=1 Tax=Candidatus Protofrankia californiensis TaxID=1839754 RepID=A0A1C3PBZ6_9ACTN|nr:putative membrane protein [Candidatus Protofrankia californiensis]